jgi:hypothetical protein
VYLTTQVRPLAVNGVPLAQLVKLIPQMMGTPPSIPSLQDDLRQLVEKFTGILGYDLARGQFPDSPGIYPPDGSWGFGHPLLLGEAAISWALLAAIIIVASREARTLSKRRRELRSDAGGGRALPHES